jgi:hypothetical protein
MTAMLGREDHASWLNEYTPGWDEAGEAELAPRVAEYAAETEFPQVFEDTVGGLDGSEDPADPLEERSGALFADEGLPSESPHAGGDGRGTDMQTLSDETQTAIKKAREMTRAMLEDDETADNDERDETDVNDNDNNA